LGDVVKNWINWVILAAVLIIGVPTITSAWYTVDQGQEAVLLRTGAIAGTEGPGLHFKVPWLDAVRYVSLQSHFIDYDEESYSRDQQPAQIKFSVNFHVPPGESAKLYAEYGSFETMQSRVIDQKAPSVLKNIFGTYDAQTAIQQRAKLNADVLTAMQAAVDGPVIVESIQIKDIKFSADYEAAIAAKQQATVKVQEQQQILAQEQVKAQIVVTQAQAQADAVVAQATAQAQATRLAGEAEGAAIKAKGDALKDNPALIELTKAEQWNGVLPTSMIPNTAIPFLQAGPSISTP
jgi:regulator of protease activity HflC (stomatin/prohibitin superfamily)